MFDLSDTHGRLSSIGLYQLIWIVQCPPCFDDHLHASLFRRLHDLLVPFSSISICVFLKDNV